MRCTTVRSSSATCPRDEERLLPHLHLARSLVANPDAFAALMEAAGPEALAMLGRVLHRRLS